MFSEFIDQHHHSMYRLYIIYSQSIVHAKEGIQLFLYKKKFLNPESWDDLTREFF